MATLQRVNKKGKKEYNDNFAGFIMSSPAIILLVAFLIIPIIYTIYYSFFTYQVVRPDNIKYGIFYCNRCAGTVYIGIGTCTDGIK